MKSVTVLLWLLGVGIASGQSPTAEPAGRMIKAPGSTVCYMGTKDAWTVVPPPKEFRFRQSDASRVQVSANIEVVYEGFSPEAQAAFQYAVDIWESLLQTEVPIRILARWSPLGEGVLGGASPGGYYVNFNNAPRKGVWYPIALAEKLAGVNLNGEEPDIVATFNSVGDSWHLSTETVPTTGTFDLASVVLHEIGHGLGITHSYTVSGVQATIDPGFSGLPVVYETFLENFDGSSLVSTYEVPSIELYRDILSQKLFFNSDLVRKANFGLRSQIYAPAAYSAGSSIAHLDEATYAAGNENSLMTPFINPAERILDPGPVAMGLLHDMGWLNTTLVHTPIKNTEDTGSSFPVSVVMKSDNGYDATSLSLNYAVDESNLSSTPLTNGGATDEYLSVIPSGGSLYTYYFNFRDAEERNFTHSGLYYRQGAAPVQTYFQFEVGPDTKPPHINHVPKSFTGISEPFTVDAIVSDNIGVESVQLEYKVNGVTKPSISMALQSGTDSTYSASVTFLQGEINIDDHIAYRVVAKDASVAGNEATLPLNGAYFEVNVTGLLPPRDSYSTTFDDPTNDFFGNGFSMATPSGFLNAALHSDHPYQQGTGFPGDSLELIYYLKVPIRISTANPVFKFDEIVLVEPGDAGSVFGDENFYDYVVVEGSTDGVTWIPVADGYDSRSNSTWLDRYNSSIVDNSSTATGDPSLFKTRSINLAKTFKAGDEVAFRFRLHSDPLATGWGWAIDNLRIQVDETPPVVYHQHIDYILTDANEIPITFSASDPSGISKIEVVHGWDGQPESVTELSVGALSDYTLTINLSNSQLEPGAKFKYRITVTDNVGNVSPLPASGDFSIVVLSFANPVSSFVSDFGESNPDVSGNYFSVAKPTGFDNLAMHSQHPYPITITGQASSLYTWVVEKPIMINGDNPYISFDEIVVLDYTTSDPLKDQVAVDFTTDGQVWSTFEDPYGTLRFSAWKTSFDNGNNPTASLFQNHRINMLENDGLTTGDVIMIRFRLETDALRNGWGWAVDNLSIQGPVTGIREERHQISAYPNPTRDQITIRGLLNGEGAQLRVFSPMGTTVHAAELAPANDFDTTLSTREWPSGLYLVTVQTMTTQWTTKFLVTK